MRKPEKFNPALLGVFGVFFLAGSCALVSQAGLPPLPSYYKAKGVVMVGTGAGQASPLPVGADDTVLVSNAASPGGVKWTPNPAVSATPSNTPSTIVLRDSSGNFSAGTISATTFDASSTTAAFKIASTTILARPIATSNYAIGSAGGSLAAGAVHNFCAGSSACNAVTTGTDIVAIGDTAFVTGTGNKNTAVGSAALNGGSGTNNTAVGWQAGNTIQSGSRNTAIGERALNGDGGNDNVGVGSTALTLLGTGSQNTAVGARALLNSTGVSNSTAVGYNACATLTTGGTNTCLGASSDVSVNNLTNATAIGYQATSSVTNGLVLGNSSALIGIGTSSPANKLHVAGTADAVQVKVASYSSQTADIQTWTSSTGTVLNSIDKYGRETQAPGSDINLLGLSSSYVLTGPTGATNRDAEVSVGDWTAYNDSSATPVDLTGGSMTAAVFSRSTSSPLDGVANFLLALDFVSGNIGEGVSVPVYIPPAYRGTMLEFGFAWKASSKISEDDIKLYAYDVTNSVLITPTWPSKIIGTGPGKAVAVFPISSTTAQIRVALHIAALSGGAHPDLTFDDVYVRPQVATYGMAGSDRLSVTMTPNSFGTVSQESYWNQRVGDTARFAGYFKAGTTAGSTCSIDLPSGLNLDTAKVPSTSSVVKVGSYNVISTAAGPGQIATGTGPDRHGVLFYDSSDTNTFFFSDQIGSNVFVKRNCNSLFATSDGIRFDIEIPISGWSSNVSMGSSSTFNISSYLASGSRVTGSAPTALGQYRSYLRNSSAATFTETNGSPTATPTVADGIRIYNGNTYASADNNNEPTKYEIFVGKNKNVKSQWYQSAGRTGYIDPRPQGTSSTDVGYIESYDPTTGIYSVTAQFRAGSGRTSHVSGVTDDGNSSANDIYFDLIVSENALAVGIQAPRSYVVAYNGNGHGGTGTKIRKYTNSTSVGTAITYTSDSTNGDTFTINEDGVYSIAMTDGAAASARRFGISLNAASNTTSMDTTLGSTEVLGMTTHVAGVESSVTVAWFLRAGSIIRAKDDGGCDFTGAANSMFRITKVSN